MNLPKTSASCATAPFRSSMTMIVIYLILAICAGRAYVESELSGGQNYLVYSIIQAITFAAGCSSSCRACV